MSLTSIVLKSSSCKQSCSHAWISYAVIFGFSFLNNKPLYTCVHPWQERKLKTKWKTYLFVKTLPCSSSGTQQCNLRLLKPDRFGRQVLSLLYWNINVNSWYICPVLTKLGLSRQTVIKSRKQNSTKIRPVGADLFHENGWREGKRDWQLWWS